MASFHIRNSIPLDGGSKHMGALFGAGATCCWVALAGLCCDCLWVERSETLALVISLLLVGIATTCWLCAMAKRWKEVPKTFATYVVVVGFFLWLAYGLEAWADVLGWGIPMASPPMALLLRLFGEVVSWRGNQVVLLAPEGTAIWFVSMEKLCLVSVMSALFSAYLMERLMLIRKVGLWRGAVIGIFVSLGHGFVCSSIYFAQESYSEGSRNVHNKVFISWEGAIIVTFLTFSGACCGTGCTSRSNEQPRVVRHGV